MGLSLGHLLIILIIVLVLFGAGKLPQMMSDMGKGMKAFKNGIKEDEKATTNLQGVTQELSSPKKVSAKASSSVSEKASTKPKVSKKVASVKSDSKATTKSNIVSKKTTKPKQA